VVVVVVVQSLLVWELLHVFEYEQGKEGRTVCSSCCLMMLGMNLFGAGSPSVRKFSFTDHHSLTFFCFSGTACCTNSTGCSG
jgi:hypothetical protein